MPLSKFFLLDGGCQDTTQNNRRYRSESGHGFIHRYRHITIQKARDGANRGSQDGQNDDQSNAVSEIKPQSLGGVRTHLRSVNPLNIRSFL